MELFTYLKGISSGPFLDGIKSSGFKRYFKNTSWLFWGKILSLTLSFFVTTYVARYLGPENYGTLSYAISFVGLFSFLSTLGLDHIFYKKVIEIDGWGEELTSTAIRLRFFASLFAFLLLLLASIFLHVNEVEFFLIAIIGLSFLFTPLHLITHIFQAKVLSKYSSITLLSVTLILSLAKVGVVYFDKGILFFSTIFLLESILYALLYLYFYKKIGGSLTLRVFNFDLAKELVRLSWPLMFYSGFTLIYTRIDQVMIGNLLNDYSVGLYDAAVRVSEMWYFIPGIIITSLFPAIVNARRVNNHSYRRRLLGLGLFIVLFAVLIALSIYVLRGNISEFLYGDDFFESISVLSVYVWAGIWVALGYLAYYILIIEEKTKALLISTSFTVICNIILNILWIPRYGIVGSAWATFFSYLLFPVISFLLIYCIKTKITYDK